MKIKLVLQAILWGVAASYFFCNSANAVAVSNLYNVNLNVADNSAETRIAQLPSSLEEVLLKVGSSKVVLENKELAVAKQQIDKYINGYSYKQNDTGYTLNIQFNDKMISQLLSKLGRNSLTKNRPLILLRLTDDGGHEELVAKIDELSKRYGLPIVVPLLDLSDMHSDAANVAQIASRYRADMVMSGKISNVANEWHCEWQLFNPDKPVTWGSNGANLDSQLELMLNHLADQLVSRHSNTTVAKYSPDSIGKIIIRVDGVNSVNDYARISSYLKNLSPVKKLEVKTVSDTELVFLIGAEGGKEAIAKAISLDRILSANSNIDGDSLSYKVNL